MVRAHDSRPAIRRACVVFSLLLSTGLLSAAEPVAAGSGSFASEPPKDREVTELFGWTPKREPSCADLPLPSNDWWTSLLRDPFPGRLWAMPATVTADGAAIRIWQPRGWNAEGTEMVLGEPLDVVGVDRAPPAADGDLVVADFNEAAWATGWTATGNAWGAGPMTPARQRVDDTAGAGFASSFNQGDRGTGVLTSPVFAIRRAYVHLLVGGGKDASKVRVELVVDGQVVHSASGRNAADLDPVSWDVAKWQGKNAQIRAVDDSTGGWGFIAFDHVVQSAKAEAPSGGVFASCSTVRWGDWTVVMRLRAAAERWVDVTCGRGLPYVWLECRDLDLRIPGQGWTLSDLQGKPAKLPLVGDGLVLERDGRCFALYGPERTRFAAGADGIDIAFAGAKRYLVIGLLPQRSDAGFFQRHAYAIPRDTRMEWTHDRVAGEVATTWTITSEALRGSERAVLQGWLPHHWRSTRHGMTFAEPVFETQRGRLRLAAGTSFRIAWPFTGIVPAVPIQPTPAGLANPFDAARLGEHLTRWTEASSGRTPNERLRADTYWGGKDILGLGQHLMIARELGHPAVPQLRRQLQEGLADWFTYTPGESQHFFARYPKPWSGLVGFKPSYGSAGFTDNHFHYGYFTLTAALAGLDDPQWLARYAPLVRLIAKQYANWDRQDPDFPFLRTFDPWGGHSYAGGASSRQDGNNQESSSEAMQSWAGLYLLGVALGDEAMTACGAMGYAIEASAIEEYWQDIHGWKDAAQANHPPAYKAKRPIVSVLRDRDIGYWTWFSGEPIHIHGIQWLPLWTSLQYLGRHPDFVRWEVERMLTAQGKGTPVTFAKLGDDWGNIALGYAQFGDPDGIARIYDEAFKAGDELAGWKRSTVAYYLTHAWRNLGTVAWDCHADLPASSVHRSADGRLTLVAWNPGAAPVETAVYRGGTVVGRCRVLPGLSAQPVAGTTSRR